MSNWISVRNSSILEPIRIPREGGGHYELPASAMGLVGNWAERVTHVTASERDPVTPSE